MGAFAKNKRPGTCPGLLFFDVLPSLGRRVAGGEESREFRHLRLRRRGGIGSAFAAWPGAGAATRPALAPTRRITLCLLGLALGGSLGWSIATGVAGSVALLSFALRRRLVMLLAVLLRLLLRLAWLRRREPIIDRCEVVVEIIVLGLELVAANLSLLGLLGRRDDPEIMLCVLQIVLGHHAVAARLGVASELEVLLGDVSRVAAHLHVRSVALVVAAQRVAVLAAAIVVPAARAVLVILLIRSHRLFSCLGKEY